MNRTDADVAFTYIGLNNVLYHRPVKDPLFSAQRKVHFDQINGGVTEYQSDNMIGAMGCAVQVRYTNVILLVAAKTNLNSINSVHRSRRGISFAPL